MDIESEPTVIRKPKTTKLSRDTTKTLPMPEPVGDFRPVPGELTWENSDSQPVWRVRLDVLSANPIVHVGLDINGDITLGRGQEHAIDLEPYNGSGLGVSRQHALLRPTDTGLFVLDLGSTNGTWRNGHPVGELTPSSLSDGDTLALGRLQIAVRVIGRPAGHIEGLIEEADPADALTHIAKAITSRLSLDEVFSQVVEMALDLTGGDEAGVWLLDEGTGQLCLEASRGPKDEKTDADCLTIDDAPMADVLESGEALRLDRETNGKKIKVNKGYSAEALVLAPMTLGGMTFGVLSVARQQPGRPFTQRDERLLVALGDFAAVAFENARLYEQAKEEIAERERVEEELMRRNMILELLNDLSRSVSITLEVGPILDTVAKTAAIAIDATSAYVCDWDEAQRSATVLAEHISPLASKPERASDLGATYAVEDGFSDPTNWLHAPQGYAVAHIDDEGLNSSERDHMEQYGAKSLLTVPLVTRGKPIGYLEVWESRERREFSLEDIEIIRAIASQVAMTIENARLYQLAQLEIEERKQAEAELARSNEELQQFAYIASHDLQEPLRMVASYTQLLARRYEGQLGEDADEFINFAVDGATRMQALINDLLAYSRVGTQGKPPEPTDCEEIYQLVVSDLQLAIEDSEAAVTHDPLPTVMADPTQTRQLLQNLTANAIKFHSEEPPRVHISAEREEDKWVFSVSDNGIGIEAQYGERIFLPFQRLHHREEYAGNGIGLSICRKIVERHGGHIWMESEPGEGTTFFFTLSALSED